MLHQLHITVEVDPALAEGMHPDLLAKLARGLRVSTCYRGVRVDGLPGMTRRAVPIFTSSADAVMHLHSLADTQVEFAANVGAASNATGRWMLDRAAFLRLAAGELIRRRRQLWPAEDQQDWSVAKWEAPNGSRFGCARCERTTSASQGGGGDFAGVCDDCYVALHSTGQDKPACLRGLSEHAPPVVNVRNTCLRGLSEHELSRLPKLTPEAVEAALLAGQDERRREENACRP